MERARTKSKCEDSNPLEGYIPLILHDMRAQQLSLKTLAEESRIAPANLSRMLNRQRPLGLRSRNKLMEKLGIDPLRALLAVEIFGDWQAYYTNKMYFISGLSRTLYPSILAACDDDIFELDQCAIDQAAEFISNRLISLDRKMKMIRSQARFGDME